MTYISHNNMLEMSSWNTPGLGAVHKFGENQNIADEATEEIWDGSTAYTFPTTADITHISQTEHDATMVNGTIEVQGLSSDWELCTQTVALNGTDTSTAVELTTPLIRVFRMAVLEDVVAAQDINLKNVGGATTYAIIQAGNNQTLMAIYTVPAGKTAYLTKYFASIVEATGKEPKSTDIKLWFADRKNGYEFQLKHAFGIPLGGSLVEYPFKPYLRVTEKTDIKITGSPNFNPAHVNAGFDLILVDN